VTFLIAMPMMALKLVKFGLFFISLHLFILFVSLFKFENKRSDVGLF
jgi:hypothetical protein